MPLEDHEKARFLLHRSLAEGISLDDRHWLDAHLEQCAECARYADLSARTARALDCFAVEFNPAAALRVENIIRSRAEKMRAVEAQTKSLWNGTAVALFLAFTGSAITWRSLAWLASQWNLPGLLWQIPFVAFWFVPSLLLAILPLFRSRLLGDDPHSNGEAV